MQRKAKSPLIALAALVTLVSLAACNTVKGAGEDVSAAGGAVTDAAQQTQDDINKN